MHIHVHMSALNRKKVGGTIPFSLSA